MEDVVDKYAYNRFGSKGTRVGQAVYDIISRDQASQTAEETMAEFGPDYAKEFQKTVEENQHRFTSPFHIFVLSKKEMWACNVVRNFFIARQTAPKALDMIADFPHHTKTLYKVNPHAGSVEILWSIPGHAECQSISRNPDNFYPELVQWVHDAYSGKLDRKVV